MVKKAGNIYHTKSYMRVSDSIYTFFVLKCNCARFIITDLSVNRPEKAVEDVRSASLIHQSEKEGQLDYIA